MPIQGRCKNPLCPNLSIGFWALKGVRNEGVFRTDLSAFETSFLLPKEKGTNLLAKESVDVYDDFVIYFSFMYSKHRIRVGEAKEIGIENCGLLCFDCLAGSKWQDSALSGLSKTRGLSFIQQYAIPSFQSSGRPPRVERQQDGTGWPLRYPVLLALRGDFANPTYLFCIPKRLST